MSMSPILFLILFIVCITTSSNIYRNINSFGPLHLHQQPLYLSFIPYFEVDPSEQEGKFLPITGVTKYETIIVKETVRPVCLLVDGNVPSCDNVHHHNDHNDHTHGPKNRQPAITDYESHFIEPSKPNTKIEMTEIPYKGTFILTDASVSLKDDEHTASSQHRTPPLRVVPVTEHVRETGTTKRQRFLPNLQWSATFGLSTTGSNTTTRNGRPPVTILVTQVERVVDDHVTVTVMPKDCLPSGHVDALKPCVKQYAAAYPVVAEVRVTDIVDKVNGLVEEFVTGQMGHVHRRRFSFRAINNGDDRSDKK